MDGATAPRIETLTRRECFRLVRSHSVGRLATTELGAPPIVVPVNYVLDGEVVVFRTDPGTKLRCLRLSPVSFEIDDIDPYHRTGWSVLIQGIAYEATVTEVSGLVLHPWTGGDKHHWVRVQPALVTGRRIHPAVGGRDPRAYL